ncbi:hypothetical protein OIE68_03330 [Nocardia vinacea]|uniref:Lipoprotein n=1 Tax=Nocardia vinacea TaxID=96468 RepID=A0ABZ1YNF9_9NOCA|nr:hypothetical protein OIE68_03330 [Nocardia vinacea]
MTDTNRTLVKNVLGIAAVGGVMLAYGLGLKACENKEVREHNVADVGECVMERGEDSIAKVDCFGANAQYRVLGKLEHSTGSTEFARMSACKEFPGTVKYYSRTDSRIGSYTLCLGRK